VAARWSSAAYPFLYEINTWPWLSQLSVDAGRRVDLGSVPDEQWDVVADAGFDAVWLMGVWERSPAGVAVALANPELVASFRAALVDYAPDDVVGSPYCIRDYEVDVSLGGRVGLASARAALAGRGPPSGPAGGGSANAPAGPATTASGTSWRGAGTVTRDGWSW
jgi:hypothetical protein